MSLYRLITAIAFFCLAQYAFADINEAWQGFSDPDILSSGFTHNYFALPREGATSYTGPKYWSSDYWPSNQGGINYRWHSPKPMGFNTYDFPLKELKRLPTRDLQSLAPSEKFDILMGRYDYPLKAEVGRSVSPRAQDWEGICHGWVMAALHHAEPKPKTFINADGVTVYFGSADIKALLTYYYAWHADGDTPTIGRRCSFGNWTGGRENCDQDLNAGAFHIVLANKLGLQGTGFVMDVERMDEVWNQPIIAYRSQFQGEFRPTQGAARSAVREFRITTQIWYVSESDNFWYPIQGTPNQQFDTKVFQYRIELNNRDEIVGGTWESTERPDFIWHKEKTRNFSGYFARLSELLND